MMASAASLDKNSLRLGHADMPGEFLITYSAGSGPVSIHGTADGRRGADRADLLEVQVNTSDNSP